MINGTAITTIPEIGLTEIEGEPRARDLDIAERLGFTRSRNIRSLIERNRAELETFGTCFTVKHVVRGNLVTEFWLNEEQALLVSVLSNAENAPAVRSMLIRTFVAWRRGHLAETPGSITDLSREVRNTLGGMIKRNAGVVVREELAPVQADIAALRAMFVTMAAIIQPAHPGFYVNGKTSGEIWRDVGLPSGVKNGARWLGNRLVEMGCQMEGCRTHRVGLRGARLFDPDKSAMCLKNGLHHKAKVYATERLGQKRLRLVTA